MFIFFDFSKYLHFQVNYVTFPSGSLRKTDNVPKRCHIYSWLIWLACACCKVQHSGLNIFIFQLLKEVLQLIKYKGTLSTWGILPLNFSLVI